VNLLAYRSFLLPNRQTLRSSEMLKKCVYAPVHAGFLIQKEISPNRVTHAAMRVKSISSLTATPTISRMGYLSGSGFTVSHSDADKKQWNI